MPIAFQVEKVEFDPTKGQIQELPFTAVFSNRVIGQRAEAAIKSYNIGYTDNDHEIFRTQIILRIVEIRDNSVSGTVSFLLRDSSGTIDDRFDGFVEVLVIAEVEGQAISFRRVAAPGTP